uniref:Uncharacterized protein n=1 Tax=Anopheles farauti TaxID=69004 RepID=A0A182QJQ0_9DIPT
MLRANMKQLVLAGFLGIFFFAGVVTSQTAARRYSAVPVRRPMTRQLVATCPSPYIANGEGKIRNRGRMIRFDCIYGFKLVGNRYANCQNGRWDTSIPVCVKSGCETLPTADKGYILYELNRASAWLSCFEGTELAGSRNTYCNGTHWDRPLGVCRRTDQTTATTCDFEAESLCGWTNDVLHDFDWKRSDGTLNPRALRTGPKYDHTTMQPKAGHFMIVDSGEQLTNETARFISPLYDPEHSVGACFQFYYHMYGEMVGTLKVYLRPMTSDLYDLKPLFVQQGNQKNVWHEGHIEIAQQSERFQIVIEASLGMRYKSDIAIDDVSLLQGDSCRVPVEDGYDNTEDQPTDAEKIPVKIDSCENRCGVSMASVFNTSDTIVHCDCHEDCVTSESCCPDFRERCVFAVAGPANSTVSTTTSAPTTSTTAKPSPTTTTTVMTTPSTTTTTVRTTTTTTTVKMTTPTTSKTTTSRATTSSTVPPTTTKRYNLRPLTPLTKKPRTTATTSTTVKTTTTTSIPTKTTTVVIPTKIPATTTQSDMAFEPTEAQYQPDEVFTPGLAAIAPTYPDDNIQKQPSLVKFFIYALLAVLFFVCILSVTYYFARKSRSSVLARLKEKSHNTRFDDIRFLAGEEDLDFNVSHAPEPDVEAMEADKAPKDQTIASKPAKLKPEAKHTKKDLAEGRMPVDGNEAAYGHARDGSDGNDDSTDEEHGGSAKKRHSKTIKKPYQKYVKYHDEDMASTLL